jgi:hypothetical protein
MQKEPAKIVAYYRTSTDDQRLGIDAQTNTVNRIATDRPTCSPTCCQVTPPVPHLFFR